MAPKVATVCDVCDKTVFESEVTSVRTVTGDMCKSDGRVVSLVYTSLTEVIGYAGYLRIVESLAVEQLAFRAYRNVCRFLYAEMQAYAAELSPSGRSAIAKTYDNVDDGRPLDIHVSFDGTWMKRGHQSHIGVGFVIECNTGFVVDFEVLSNYCEMCTKKSNSLSEVDFAAWKGSHADCK